MTTCHGYRIAGFGVELTLPTEYAVARLLPTMEPFRSEQTNDERILRVTVAALETVVWPDETGAIIEDQTNDMGHVRLMRLHKAFEVQLSHLDSGHRHRMRIAEELAYAEIGLDWSDPRCGAALSSLVRIALSQALLAHDAVSMHASAVVSCEEAILFLGKSGTGKSTHARLWLDAGAALLNDDNPFLRLEGDRVVAYGTPWSGKTPCYKAEGYPVRGVVRLSQSRENRYTALKDADAFVALLPSCSVIRKEDRLHDRLCDLLGEMIPHIAVGHLACRPDADAQRCAWAGLYTTKL